jgi:hypothetical protein
MRFGASRAKVLSRNGAGVAALLVCFTAFTEAYWLCINFELKSIDRQKRSRSEVVSHQSTPGL